MKKRLLQIGGIAAAGVAAWLAFGQRDVPVSFDHGGKPVERWLQELRHDDYVVRDAALEAVREMGDKALPHLVSRLRHRDSKLREVLVGLADRWSPGRLGVIEAHLEREVAARTLAELPERSAKGAPELVELLDDEWGPAAEEAQRAVRLMGAPAIPHLITALREGGVSLRAAAASSLREIDPAPRSAFAALREAAGDSSERVRKEAAVALRLDSESTGSVDVLRELLEDESNEVRSAAAESLGHIRLKARAAVGSLRVRLFDSNVVVRIQAAKALWKIEKEAERPLETLIEAMGDERAEWMAVMAIAEMDEAAAPAAPHLIRALEREPMHRPFRSPPASAFALGRIGKPAMAALTDALGDSNWKVRAGAALALGMHEELDERATSALTDRLEDKDELVRHAAAMTLIEAEWNDKRLTPVLEEMLNADDDVVRFAAGDALKRVDPDLAWTLRNME